MNERLLKEFSHFYKRIIRIERNLKDLIIYKYSATYGNKTYNVLYKIYFSYLRKNSLPGQNIFNEIYKQKGKSDQEKLILSIDKLYISEVLSFFSHRIFLKDITRKNFFKNAIKTNKNDFRKTAQLLKDFRNCVCHFDTKQYLIEKGKFVEVLLFFENLLECKFNFTKEAIESISHNLSVKSILNLIYLHNPDCFNDDRVLVDVFDDIAALAGFRADNLPQYKSIIRSKFSLEEKNNIEQKLTQRKASAISLTENK